MTGLTGRSVLRAPVVITARAATAVSSVVVVAPDEPVLRGHYPDFPVLPGVCVVECAHRTALAAAPAEPAGLELAAIESARFLGPVFAGDRLTVELTWATPDPDWLVTAVVGTTRGRVARLRLRYHAGHLRSPEPSALVDPAAPGPGPDVEEITRLIPHRPPMLLLDRIDQLVPRAWLAATWTPGPPWSDGDRAYPPVLLVESWCQAAGVLAVSAAPELSAAAGRLMLLGGVRDAELFGPVFPGDRIEHRVRLASATEDVAVLSGESSANGRVVARVRRIVVAMRPATELEEVG